MMTPNGTQLPELTYYDQMIELSRTIASTYRGLSYLYDHGKEQLKRTVDEYIETITPEIFQTQNKQPIYIESPFKSMPCQHIPSPLQLDLLPENGCVTMVSQLSHEEQRSFYFVSKQIHARVKELWNHMANQLSIKDENLIPTYLRLLNHFDIDRTTNQATIIKNPSDAETAIKIYVEIYKRAVWVFIPIASSEKGMLYWLDASNKIFKQEIDITCKTSEDNILYLSIKGNYEMLTIQEGKSLTATLKGTKGT
jgi:hypothetical protein